MILTVLSRTSTLSSTPRYWLSGHTPSAIQQALTRPTSWFLSPSTGYYGLRTCRWVIFQGRILLLLRLGSRPESSFTGTFYNAPLAISSSCRAVEGHLSPAALFLIGSAPPWLAFLPPSPSHSCHALTAYFTARLSLTRSGLPLVAVFSPSPLVPVWFVFFWGSPSARPCWASFPKTDPPRTTSPLPSRLQDSCLHRFLCLLPHHVTYRSLNRFMCRLPSRFRCRHLNRLLYHLIDRSIDQPLVRFLCLLPDRLLGRLLARFLSRLLDRSACRLIDHASDRHPTEFLARFLSASPSPSSLLYRAPPPSPRPWYSGSGFSRVRP